MTRTAFDTAKARLHRFRKSAGVTDLQATALSELLAGTSKGIEKSVRETGAAAFAKDEAEAIVRATKALGDGDWIDEADAQLAVAIVAVVACEFRAAGYAVYGAAENDGGITVALI